LNRRLLPFFALVAVMIVLCGWREFAAAGQQSTPPDVAGTASGQRVVLTIGDEKITAAEIEDFIRALPAQYQAYYGGPGKRLLPQYIIAMKVLSAEALKLKLAEQPDVAQALEIARESVLSDAARKHFYQSIVISEQELRDLYQKDKTLTEEVRLRHILIQTENAPLSTSTPGHPALSEPEARKKLEEIRQQILSGADFAAMAKKYSEDTATAASGGDMGVLQRDKVVPAVVNAAHTLEPGQVSDILTTPYGLEIVQVAGKRTKSFEEVKQALETELRQSKTEELVKRLMDNYHFVIDQEYFAGPATKQNSPPSPPSP
jgi:hypothetical protein